jgi:hypothetical protein
MLFLATILASTAGGYNLFSWLRRFLGALLPWTIGFFLVVTNSTDPNFLTWLFHWPPGLLAFAGLVLGAGLIEGWRSVATLEHDLIFAVINAILSTMLLGVLTFMLYPDYRATAWIVLPLYIGMMVALIFRGWPGLQNKRPGSHPR